jgi:paraquat-inducible protein A
MDLPGLRVLTLVSTVLLGIGLFGPCMTIQPSFGEYHWLVEYFKPDTAKPTTYSIWSGILHLFRDGDVLVGIIVFVFSVVFPVWKLCVLWAGANWEESKPAGYGVLKLVANLGKVSMLDVFVVALLVLAIKGLPGGTKVLIGWGVWAFCGSILISMWVSMKLAHLYGKRGQ